MWSFPQDFYSFFTFYPFTDLCDNMGLKKSKKFLEPTIECNTS